MTANRPRVTIGLPVFNGERYLAATLDSILAQDFEDFELVVSDNASTDATVDIVLDHQRHDSRIRLLRNDHNKGAAFNYNRLVHDAHGDLFKWAGYDDLLVGSYLRRCVTALDSDDAAVLAFPRTVIIDSDGSRVIEYEDRLDLRDDRSWLRVARFARRVNLCNACFGVMRREVMLTTGLIRPYAGSDVLFLAEMAARGKMIQIREQLFLRRVHEGSSRQGHTTMADVARWFDTSATKATRAPHLRLFAGCLTALAVTPGPVVQRIGLVTAYAASHVWRRMRVRSGQARAVLTGRKLPRPELIHQLDGSDR